MGVCCRLRELDEANGHAANVQAAHDDLTDNGVVEGRTGAVHHGIKQDIVRQWLDKAAPPDSHTLQGLSPCAFPMLC